MKKPDVKAPDLYEGPYDVDTTKETYIIEPRPYGRKQSGKKKSFSHDLLFRAIYKILTFDAYVMSLLCFY